MTRLHETLEGIAGEITPADPPVELTMLRGRRKRNRRRATAITGTAGVMALAVGAALGIPALTSRPAPAPGPASAGKPADVPIARPVLLYSSSGSSVKYGDPRLVNAATTRLFGRLTCQPGTNALTVSNSWKTSVGYTAARWNAPDSQVVSCDAYGDKYVLGPAVFLGTDVTSVRTELDSTTNQWLVVLTLNGKAASAFGTLTTNQYNSYYSGYQSGNENDQFLDSTAIVIKGDVQSTPLTAQPITAGSIEIPGPAPSGFTEAEAAALAAQL